MKTPTKKTDWRANPGRDWRLLIGIWFAFLVLLLAGGWWLAGGVTNSSSPAQADETATSTLTIDRPALEKAAALIDARADNFAKFQLENPDVVDPSQP